MGGTGVQSAPAMRDRARSGPLARASIWHGTADSVVNDANVTELVKQWTDANGIDQTADAQDSVDGFPHAEYEDAAGETRLETYTITGRQQRRRERRVTRRKGGTERSVLVRSGRARGTRGANSVFGAALTAFAAVHLARRRRHSLKAERRQSKA